jgi:hypothetical protein
MSLMISPPPGVYVEAFEDGTGETLNGSHTYRLRVPPHVPIGQFWSVVAYEADAAGFLGHVPTVRLEACTPDVDRNADGSVDLYFAPEPPDGHATNWISTVEGRPFFVLFRHDAATAVPFTEAPPWILDQIVRVA